jgi:hypothetical protein
MEEPEVPTEHLHEHIHEAMEESHSKKRWSMYLAISTALMAVLAAISSLEAGHHSNEAMISQIKASDKWAYYQAKGIKYEITENTLGDSHGSDSAKLSNKLVQYKIEQGNISKEATDHEKESSDNLERYKILATAVTLLQVSIAISAISMLTHKRFLWYISLFISVIGIWQFIMGNL